MTLGRTKHTYVIVHALGPYFYNHLTDDMDGSYFSLQFDETTNAKDVKELRILVNFWSKALNRPSVRHLETVFIGQATAKIITDHIVSAIDKSAFSLSGLIMIGSDGPNVNKSIFSKMNEKVKELRGKPLLNVGSCNIHVVHNAFLKGLLQFGIEISDIAIAMHSFIHDFPVRQENFEKIQHELNLPSHRLVKHVPSRWLTLSAACKRMIEQLPALKEFFLKFIPKCANAKELMKIRKYKIISEFLGKPSSEAELHFISDCTNLFTQFTGKFQGSEPLIHLLYEEMDRLVTVLINRICKKRLPATELFAADNLLSYSNVVLSAEVLEKLKALKEQDVLTFKNGVRNFYTAAIKHLFEKSVLQSSLSIVKKFRFLSPQEIKRKRQRNEEDMKAIFLALPVAVPLDETVDELKLLYSEIDAEPNMANMAMLDFWRVIFANKKYPNLTNLVKTSLLIFHGSADVERSFSDSANILTDNKTGMSIELLNARLNIKSALKQYQNKIEDIPITNELLKMVKLAGTLYKENMERKKRETEEAQKKREEDKKIKEAMKKKKDEMEENKKTLLALEDDLKNQKHELATKRKAYNDTLEIANKKLKKSVDKNDISGARVAQAIIEGASKLKDDEISILKKCSSLEKKIKKINTQLIQPID